MKITREKLLKIIKEELSLVCEYGSAGNHPQTYLSGVDQEEIEKINSLARHEDKNFGDVADSIAAQFGYKGDSYSRDLFFYDFEQKYASEFARMEDDDVIITVRLGNYGGDAIKIWNYTTEFFKQPDKMGFYDLVAKWSMKNINATFEDLYKTGGGNNKQNADALSEMMDRVFSSGYAIYITASDIEALDLQDVVANHQDKTELRHYN